MRIDREILVNTLTPDASAITTVIFWDPLFTDHLALICYALDMILQDNFIKFHSRGPGVPIWPITKIDFMVFSERGELDLPAVLPHQKILIVAKVIASQRSAPVYFYCTHDFQARFASNNHFWNSKIYLLLRLFSNHPQTFRICSRHKNKENDWTQFCFGPLNSSYWIFRFLGPKKSSKNRLEIFKVH